MLGQVGESGAATQTATNASTVYRARRVLAIKPFRRLWTVMFLCSTADWLTLLGLTGLVTKLTETYMAQNFAFSGVVLTLLLPGLIFAPLGGLLADRFDRRKVMVAADVVRCVLLLSIALVGSPLWLFAANFMVGFASTMWIPSKEAAVPNLLRRRDQVETANQLGMVMTYGFAVVAGAGSYALITVLPQVIGLPEGTTGEFGIAKFVVICTGLLYLLSAIIIATRIPELSLRNVHEDDQDAKGASTEDAAPVGFLQMIKDGARYVRSTKLVRGLLIGMVGAFAAGGAVVGSSKPYAASLLAGESAFGMMFVCVFLGLAGGMAGAPKLAHRLPHDRLFGIAIVFAGFALMAVAAAPHLIVALAAVTLVGACAGAAFLTGVTIIGTQVEDAIRGRINAIYQSLMKIILGGSVAVVPLLIGLVRPRVISVFDNRIVIDGTRPVLLGGGVLAALVGVAAYRLMDSRRTEPIMADLRNVLRRRPRRANGLLIAIEGTTATDTADQAAKLALWLRRNVTQPIALATDPALDDKRLTSILTNASLTGARARALAAAAVRADIVERDVRPALDNGGIVVMERFADSSLAHLSTVAGLDADELEGLADWATDRLRPDITLLLDTEPTPDGDGGVSHQQWRMRGLLSEMAAADPDRYVVIDADGPPDEVAERVRTAVEAVLLTKGIRRSPNAAAAARDAREAEEAFAADDIPVAALAEPVADVSSDVPASQETATKGGGA
ncbi:bifunctional MFS transporter/dTMP kinase [Haloechinothrix salitolerans]|uniref:Thymidylate kinase n=1 Tax=Haloechinothrix salitolerans TaxID=926830 RepID=A0ABW2BWB7_9PSEU